MKKILLTRLGVCSLGVSCNEMIDTPMLLVVTKQSVLLQNVIFYHIVWYFSKIILPQIVVFHYKI